MTRHLALFLIGTALLAACSRSTTISDWSCPTDQPDGCFTVAASDDVAIAALKAEATAVPGKVTLRTLPAGSAGSAEPAGSAGAISDNTTVFTSASETKSTIESIQRNISQPAPAKTPHTVSSTASNPISRPNDLASMHRVPDRVAKIWIGPFEDASGNYHPASILFIIVEPSRWRAGP